MVEIVEFYQIMEKPKKGRIFGSLHVYILEGGIDLRGIKVFNHGKNWFFKIPTIKTLDSETKEPVQFPIFGYLDKEKDREFKQTIKKLAVPYIQKKLKEKNNESRKLSKTKHT